MKKIICLGDSITDMGRTTLNGTSDPWCFGVGYPQFLNGLLQFLHPHQYEVINQGISGNRVVDLYARIKKERCMEFNSRLSIYSYRN